MKKKIALFMAAIMSLTTVPAFAANTVSTTPLGQAGNKKEGIYDGTLGEEGVAHFVDIVLDEDVEFGSQFRAELVGATFANIADSYDNDFYSVFDPGDSDDAGVDRNVYLAGRLPGSVDATLINTIPTGESVAWFDYYVASPTEGHDLTPAEAAYAWQAKNTPGKGAAINQSASAVVTALEKEITALVTDAVQAEIEINAIKAELTARGALSPAATTTYANATTRRLYDLWASYYKQWTTANTQLKAIVASVPAVIGTGTSAVTVDVVYTDASDKDVTLTLATIKTNMDQGTAANPAGPLGTATAPAKPPTDIPATSLAAVGAIFSIANAGYGINEDGFVRTVWSNMYYSGNKGVSAEAGVAFVRKTGDSKITVTIMDDIDVPSGVDVVIRLPIPIEINDDAESVEFNITNGGGFLAKKNFLLVDTTGGGTVTTSDNAKGREIIYLEDIRIEESAVGILGPKGAFELIAPDGYRFKNRLNQVKLDTDPDSTFSIGTEDVSAIDYDDGDSLQTTNNIIWTDDDDQTSLAIYLENITPSERLTSAILVQGLVIEPLDDDDIVDGEELFMEIAQYEEHVETVSTRYDLFQDARNNGAEIPALDVTEEEFKVATSVDWAVTLTPEEVVTLEAGRWAEDVDDDFHATAELTLIETEKGGWLADRTTEFTLPEGVEIRGFEVTEVDNLADDVLVDGESEFDQFFENAVDLGMFEGVTGTTEENKDYGVVDTEDFSQGKVTINENVMTWKNVEVDTTDITSIKFKLYLSIAPTFEGDEIAIELGGTAIIDEVEPVVVAEVLHPITVTTKVTDVQIGYQKYSVADIIIQENFAGAILEEEDGLVVSMDNDRAGGLELRGYDTMTIEGDIKLDDDGAKDYANGIVFDVVRASKTASTITLKGVEVYVDRTVPYGTYDVSVHGESVFANRNDGAWAHNDDDDDAVTRSGGDPDEDEAVFARFGDAYAAAYVNLATEGAYTPLRSHVVISDNNPVVIVDGVERTMVDVVPYRTTAEGASFMVPVRFASEVFGVETKDTLWDDASGTFTLFTGGKTIQFIKNADFYRINSVDVKMMTGDVVVKSEVDPVAGRMYIPFRHLGRAFGIADTDITYNEATGTAEYNQPRVN